MDKKIFGVWIAICIGGFLFWKMSNETDTSDTTAFKQCLAENNIELDQSVFDNYRKAYSELTDEDYDRYVKEILENGDATMLSEDIDGSLSKEIKRYTELAMKTCKHTI